MKIIKQCMSGILTPIECIYHLFYNSKILAILNVIIILIVLLLKIPIYHKTLFLGISLSMLLYLWTNTILFAKKMIEIGIRHHLKTKKVILVIFSLIITYSLAYYAIYNYNNPSFSGNLDKTDGKEDDESGYKGSFGRYLDMVYFTITTMFTGNYGDIVPRDRFTRFIVITQFIISAVLISVLLAKSD